MAFQFNSLSKKQQLAVSLGIPGAVAIVLIWVIYQKLGVLGPDPAFAGIPFFQREVPENLWGQINDKQSEIDQKDKIIEKLAIRKAELVSLQGEIMAARDMLPRDKDVLELTQTLGLLARQIPSDVGKVTTGDVRVDYVNGQASRTAASANDLPQITFELDIEGDINGIIKYIDSIEKLKRYVAVTNLSIKPGKVTADKATQEERREKHRAHLRLISYTYTPKKAGGK